MVLAFSFGSHEVIPSLPSHSEYLEQLKHLAPFPLEEILIKKGLLSENANQIAFPLLFSTSITSLFTLAFNSCGAFPLFFLASINCAALTQSSLKNNSTCRLTQFWHSTVPSNAFQVREIFFYASHS